MIEKMANNLICQMSESKLIDKDMEERYIYVFICRTEKFITLGTIILISMIVQKFISTLFFLVFFLELRKRTGGYHLNKFYKCYLATVAFYLTVVIISEKLMVYRHWIFIMLATAIVLIVVIGTVNHPNMHMNSVELAESKKAARIMVLLEASIIYGSALMGVDMIFISYMAIAVIFCAVLLCIAKILNQEVKENEES